MNIRPLIEIEAPVERAILVAAPRRRSRDAMYAEQHLDELERLADTAGAPVVGRLIQQVARPNPKSYIGAGKLAELASLAARTDATLVVFDEELSPAQGKNLEQALDLRVMDRSELILDIFASRAKTKEAKMEVELAQLEYLLPRLARMWVHLSRIRGGIGLRGPGETQLETDRRMIRHKISRLKKDLERVASHREVLRAGRRDILTVALVGYTNAGKSSLLRALTGADPFIEDRLFATLDTLTRETMLNYSGTVGQWHSGTVARRDSASSPVSRLPSPVSPVYRVRFVDTVGFIRKLPHDLVASFRATLDEALHADVLLHVIDASHPEWEEQVQVVNDVLADLGSAESRLIHVFNKIDLVVDPDAFRTQVRAHFDDIACTSAANGDVSEVREVLARHGGG